MDVSWSMDMDSMKFHANAALKFIKFESLSLPLFPFFQIIYAIISSYKSTLNHLLEDIYNHVLFVPQQTTLLRASTSCFWWTSVGAWTWTRWNSMPMPRSNSSNSNFLLTHSLSPFFLDNICYIVYQHRKIHWSVYRKIYTIISSLFLKRRPLWEHRRRFSDGRQLEHGYGLDEIPRWRRAQISQVRFPA